MAALKSLRRGQNENCIKQELEQMQAGCQGDEEGSWQDLCSKGLQRPVIVALVVLTMQVGTGIDVIAVYAPDIFDDLSSTSSDSGLSCKGCLQLRKLQQY